MYLRVNQWSARDKTNRSNKSSNVRSVICYSLNAKNNNFTGKTAFKTRVDYTCRSQKKKIFFYRQYPRSRVTRPTAKKDPNKTSAPGNHTGWRLRSHCSVRHVIILLLPLNSRYTDTVAGADATPTAHLPTQPTGPFREGATRPFCSRSNFKWCLGAP